MCHEKRLLLAIHLKDVQRHAFGMLSKMLKGPKRIAWSQSMQRKDPLSRLQPLMPLSAPLVPHLTVFAEPYDYGEPIWCRGYVLSTMKINLTWHQLVDSCFHIFLTCCWVISSVPGTIKNQWSAIEYGELSFFTCMIIKHVAWNAGISCRRHVWLMHRHAFGMPSKTLRDPMQIACSESMQRRDPLSR